MIIKLDVGYLCDRDEIGLTGIEKYIERTQIIVTLLNISTGK